MLTTGVGMSVHSADGRPPDDRADSPPMTVSFTIMVSDSTSIRDASLIGGNPHEAARNSAPAQASNVVATFTGLALRHKFETTTSREIT